MTHWSTSTVIANYRYNALSQRLSEQYDCNNATSTGVTDDVVDANDPTFFIALDQQGRRVATFRGVDTNPKETFLYHFNGSSPGSGPGFVAGAVLLRDRNASLTNPALWATETASATRAERYFYCTDPRGSTLALISATGVPYALPQGDVDGDGAVTAADVTIAQDTATYQVRKDLNLDGTLVGGADLTIVNSKLASSAGRGEISAAGVANRKGFGGWECEWGREIYCYRLQRSVNTLVDSTPEPRQFVEDQTASYIHVQHWPASICREWVNQFMDSLKSPPSCECRRVGEGVGISCCMASRGPSNPKCETEVKKAIAACEARRIWDLTPAVNPCQGLQDVVNAWEIAMGAAELAMVACVLAPFPSNIACVLAAEAAYQQAYASRVAALVALNACLAAPPASGTPPMTRPINRNSRCGRTYNAKTTRSVDNR